MALNKKEKTKIIKDVGSDEKDTGSSEVQIALLSKAIDKLVLHLKKTPTRRTLKKGINNNGHKKKKIIGLSEKNIRKEIFGYNQKNRTEKIKIALAI